MVKDRHYPRSTIHSPRSLAPTFPALARTESLVTLPHLAGGSDMGQRADSKRNAALDEQKTRAAGRQGNANRGEIRDAMDATRSGAKGRSGGAFGKEGVANRRNTGTGATSQ